MASRNRAWIDAIEASLARAGVVNVERVITAGQHLRFRGNAVVGANKVPITLVCSLTPSDHRAIHRVRADIRRMVNAAKAMT